MAGSSGPDIITDGLVLCLDAGDINSYAGSGTTWIDLSGQGVNGTLENGIGYSGNNLGSLVFDGSNQYATLGANPILQSIGSYTTIECWFRSSDIGSNRYGVLIGWGDGNNYYSNFGIGNWGSFSSYESIYLGYNSDVQCYVEESNSTYHDGNWHHAVVTIGPSNHRFFVDGIQKIVTFSRTDGYSVSNIFGFSSATTVQIGNRPYAGGSGYFKGEIPLVRIYSRILSTQEIQQNFEAMRARFGV